MEYSTSQPILLKCSRAAAGRARCGRGLLRREVRSSEANRRCILKSFETNMFKKFQPILAVFSADKHFEIIFHI